MHLSAVNAVKSAEWNAPLSMLKQVHILYCAMMSSKSEGFIRYQGARKVHDTALQIYLIIHLINFSLELSI